MSYRDLFRRIMSYDHFDKMPVIHWDEWKETRERWIREGLPRYGDDHLFFRAPSMWETLIAPDSWLGVGSPADVITIGLFPPFEEEVLEENSQFRILRNKDGTVTKEFQHETSMPQYLDHSFKTAADWEQYKRRLQPDLARISPHADLALRSLSESDLPVCFPVGSLMGWARNWMGLENLSYLMHDDRDVFSDIVGTIADLTCWMMDQILPRIQVDIAHVWEDMSGVNGPLISPEVFKECVAPGYLKIRNRLDAYGVHLLEMDTDGDVSRFAGDLLDSGVNVLFPVEVGTFKGDAAALRKRYGKELRLVGNFDKMTLERGRDAVSAEIERLLPLMGQGGYIIMPDHHITPGVSLQMYCWYLDEIRTLRFPA
jgi:uroporphyrinogen-III decarboxylase